MSKRRLKRVKDRHSDGRARPARAAKPARAGRSTTAKVAQATAVRVDRGGAKQDRQAGSGPARLISAVTIALAGALVYLNSFAGVFVLDDIQHIVENPRIQQLTPVSHWLSTRRPMVSLSLAVNYAIGGLNPRGYHVFNLVVHVLAGLTLFGVVRRTLLLDRFRNAFPPAQADAGVANRFALAAALLWVVHPLLTQSVTYVIQRGESMMGLFYLLTLYCVIRGAVPPAQAGSRRPRARLGGPAWYAAAIAACALGMGSKAVMVTAPLVVLLYDRTFIADSFVRALWRRWGLYVGLAATWSVLAVSGVVRGVLNSNPPGPATVGFGFKGITPLQYLLTQPGVILHYLKLCFWPHPLCLNYNWPVAETAAKIILPGVVVVALLVATLWALHRRWAPGFLGACFFLILAPTSSFIPISDIAFEHRMYLPLAVVVVLVTFGGHRAIAFLSGRASAQSRVARWVPAVAVIILATGLGLTTVGRNRVYHSAEAMWRDVLEQAPHSPRARINLGKALLKQRRFDESIECFTEALRLAPGAGPSSRLAHNNLGLALVEAGRIAEAINHYSEALRYNPGDAEVCTNFGVALMRQGKAEEAIALYREALQKNPRSFSIHSNLGALLAEQGKISEAIDCYHEALRHWPNRPETHNNLANALLAIGRTEEAIVYYRSALRLKPNTPEIHNNLATALAGQGKVEEAVSHLVAAIGYKPDYGDAHRNLAILLDHQGKTSEALRECRTALSLQPADADTYFLLGTLLSQAGAGDEAVRAYRQALRINPNHHQARERLKAAQGDDRPPGTP